MTHNGNGAPQNKRPMVYIKQSQNRSTTFKEQKTYIYAMTTNHWQDFLMKNVNNKVIRNGLELATYNLTSELIFGAHNKAADCLSHLVELPQDRLATVNMLSATYLNGPTFNTRSRTAQYTSSEDTTLQSDAVIPEVIDTPSTTTKSLTMDKISSTPPNAQNGPIL